MNIDLARERFLQKTLSQILAEEKKIKMNTTKQEFNKFKILIALKTMYIDF